MPLGFRSTTALFGAVTLTAVPLAGAPAFAQDNPPPAAPGTFTNVFETGHVDAFNVTGTADGLTLDLREDITPKGAHHRPEDVLLRVRSAALMDGLPTTIPGAPRAYVLPMTQDSNLLWPGWNTLAAEAAGFKRVDITVSEVQGPGKVSVFQNDWSGAVTSVMRDGGHSLPGTIVAPFPAHTHANWTFTTAGTYRLKVQASGQRNGVMVRSNTAVYTFQVGPESVTIAPPATVVEGAPVALAASAKDPGTLNTYRWSVKAPGGAWQVLDGATAATAELPARAGTQVKVALLGETGQVAVESAPVTLRTTPAPADPTTDPVVPTTSSSTTAPRPPRPEPTATSTAPRPTTTSRPTPPRTHRPTVTPKPTTPRPTPTATRPTTAPAPSAPSRPTSGLHGTTPAPIAPAPAPAAPDGGAPGADLPVAPVPVSPFGGATSVTPAPAGPAREACLPHPVPAAAEPGSDAPAGAEQGGPAESGAPGASEPSAPAAAPTSAPSSGPAPAAPATSQPQIGTVTEGHLDLGVRLDGGKLVASMKDDRKSPPVWGDPASATIVLGEAAKKKAPAGVEFVAKPGEDLWMIGASQESGVPWLGSNSMHESVVGGTTGPVTWTLDRVTGPGKFAMFSSGPFGGGVGTRLMDTVGGPNSFVLPANTHQHNNWVFTKPGTYTVALTQSATTKSGAKLSAATTVHFQVGGGSGHRAGMSAALPAAAPLTVAESAGALGLAAAPALGGVQAADEVPAGAPRIEWRTASGAACTPTPAEVAAAQKLPGLAPAAVADLAMTGLPADRLAALGVTSMLVGALFLAVTRRRAQQ